ncbi:DUF6382 domain-containing protein [Amphibacillus jilinensis]|uniref:DUF6382 domain-containing protein n=1 Tax=Amphibacillus jilinensis TaxID=1216008 RepID=UPI0003153032|nr:DUF6382 domain-containing protein [Amphibacillus jilinensis]
MTETMLYRLHYDFVQQNGHYMMIRGTDQAPITSDDLVRIQVNMLKANEIERVLPIEIEEIDFQVKLYYNITGKKMLAHRLREDKLTMQACYQLLYQITLALEASEEYMLTENQFAIHQDFIFIGKDFKSIELLYLPLAKLEEKPTLAEELRALLFYLVGFVDELTGQGVQQLTQYLQSPNFNVKELKAKLKHLQTTEHSQGNQPTVDPVQTPKPVLRPTPTVQQKPQQPKEAPKPKPKSVIQPKQDTPAPNKGANQKTTPTSTSSEKKKPSPIIIACLAVIALAIVWRVYVEIANASMLYVSASLSLIIVAVAVYFIFIYEGKKIEETDEADQQEKAVAKRTVAKQRPEEKKAQPIAEPPSQPQVEMGATEAAVDPARYFQELENQTTLLSQPNATMLLNEEEDVASDLSYLMVNRQGKTEKIIISQDPFLIGRNAASVNYMEDSVGISRTHLEINQTDQGYSIKDLGSKNGSKKNGNEMVAYKSYPLRHGDQVTIGKIDYTFQKV